MLTPTSFDARQSPGAACERNPANMSPAADVCAEAGSAIMVMTAAAINVFMYIIITSVVLTVPVRWEQSSVIEQLSRGAFSSGLGSGLRVEKGRRAGETDVASRNAL